MSKEVIVTDKAPAPMPIYSQAIRAGGLIFCSGQTGRDATGAEVAGTVQDRARQCIENLGAVLEAGGSSLDKAVEVNIFLTDIDDFAKVNEVYIQYFGAVKPARTCVAVKQLPGNTDVEIKCIALA